MLQEDEYWPSVGSKPRNQDEQQTVVCGAGAGAGRDEWVAISLNGKPRRAAVMGPGTQET